MKRFMLFVSALAAMVLAGSCQQELDPVTDGDTTVTFTVSAGDIATRAIADGTNIDALHWEIYKTAEIATAAQPLGEKTIIDTDKNKEFNVELKLLADQDYTIIFWAEVNGAGHYNTADLRNVQINDYANEMANDESRAAFFKVYPFSTENGVAINETIELTRPFAQINLGSTTYETSFNNVNEGNVLVKTTEMTVTNIATSFNTLTGKGEGEQAVTFEAAATPNAPKDATDKLLLVNDLYYYWLGMNYLIVCGDSDNVKVDVTLVTNFGDVNHTVTNVPVKENYRTNLLGDFLTTGATFNVVIDEEFQTPDEVIVNNGWSNVNGFNYVVNGEAPEDALAQILAHANAAANAATKAAEGPVVTIDLSGDVFWATGAGIGSTPLLPVDSPISAVVINGNGNTFTATGAGVGPICLANGGVLTFNNLKIVDKSVSYAENSWEYGYLEMAGVLELIDCEVVNAIMIEGEEATFNGCSFNSNHDNEYAVWVSDGKAYFNGCSFTGARGLKTHEAYGSEVLEIVVDGCWFGPLSKKPGVAIGTMNAATSITIKNSKFSGCQAGDQNLYIYETDTDVTTFEFKLENNEVFADESKMLADAIAEAEAGSTVEIPAGEYAVSTYKAGVELKGIGNPENVILNVADKKFGVNGNVIIENVTLVFSNANYTGFQHTDGEIYRNCIIKGQPFLYGNNVRFENCTFIQTSSDAYNVWTYGAKNVVFEGCTFNSAGKSVLVYHETSSLESVVTLNECTLNASVPVEGKAAIEIDGSLVKKFTVNINSTVANGFAAGSKSNSTLWNVKKGEEKADVYVDGHKMYADGVGLEDGVYLLYDAAGMNWFANQVNENGNSFSGKTVKLAADIDLADVVWTPVGQTGATQFLGTFDGQNHMITNLAIDATAQTGANYSSGLFGWLNAAVVKNVKIDGATVKGNHNVGVIAGYLETSGCTVENCHISKAVVECHVANDDANGDKCGVLVGHAGNAGVAVKNCTATDSAVSAGRDAGQIVGAAKAENVTGCSATNVTVTANDEGTGANIRNEVIGRIL